MKQNEDKIYFFPYVYFFFQRAGIIYIAIIGDVYVLYIHCSQNLGNTVDVVKSVPSAIMTIFLRAVSRQPINILTSNYFVLSSMDRTYTDKIFIYLCQIVFQKYEFNMGYFLLLYFYYF
jgi:hypothetical protein